MSNFKYEMLSIHQNFVLQLECLYATCLSTNNFEF